MYQTGLFLYGSHIEINGDSGRTAQ